MVKFPLADNNSLLSDSLTNSEVQQLNRAPVIVESDAISVLLDDGSFHVGRMPEDRGSGSEGTDDRNRKRSCQESDVCNCAGGVRTRPVDCGDPGYVIACHSHLGPALYYQVVGFDLKMRKVQLVGIEGRMIVVPFAEIRVLKSSQNAQMFGSRLVMKNERLR